MNIRTYSASEAAQQMGAPSARWLVHQLRSGRFTGRKIGRSWRMTDQDIADSLDTCRNDGAPVAQVIPITGLTARSRKRVVGK